MTSDSVEARRRGVERRVEARMGISRGQRTDDRANKRSLTALGEAMALPEIAVLPVQDLNPESETFGQFFDMLDFDEVP